MGTVFSPSGHYVLTTRADQREMTPLDHLTMNLTRMQLHVTEPITLHITGDGVTTLDLAGPWSGGAPRVTDNGARVNALVMTDSHLVVRLDLAGTHTLVVTPA